MKVRQPLLGERVERQRRADRVGNAAGPLPQVSDELIRTALRLGGQQVGGIPELTLPLVVFHQAAHRLLEVLEHFNFQGQLASRIGGNAHVCPFWRGTFTAE
jgi:hypothetical protein